MQYKCLKCGDMGPTDWCGGCNCWRREQCFDVMTDPLVITKIVNRGGHDGIANGGDFGWHFSLFTDGNVSESKVDNGSWAQYGHRLNKHETKITVTWTVTGGSWAVVRERYKGQIYDHPDCVIVYGRAPDDWRKKEPVVGI